MYFVSFNDGSDGDDVITVNNNNNNVNIDQQQQQQQQGSDEVITPYVSSKSKKKKKTPSSTASSYITNTATTPTSSSTPSSNNNSPKHPGYITKKGGKGYRQQQQQVAIPIVKNEPIAQLDQSPSLQTVNSTSTSTTTTQTQTSTTSTTTTQIQTQTTRHGINDGAGSDGSEGLEGSLPSFQEQGIYFSSDRIDTPSPSHLQPAVKLETLVSTLSLNEHNDEDTSAQFTAAVAHLKAKQATTTSSTTSTSTSTSSYDNVDAYSSYGNAPAIKSISSQEMYINERLKNERSAAAAAAALGGLSQTSTNYDNGPSSTTASITPDVGGKYGLGIGWNEKFQRLLLLPEDDLDKKYVKYKHLSSLSKDFLHAAITYGKIIIEEAFIDTRFKTIMSVPSLGGQAGGEKYVYNGILFKFASDWIKIYGNDEFSMKAGGHELKSVMRYYGCEGIHVPLMALLDYRGFRLVAMSILPIVPKKTIVYGSADGGKSVVAARGEVFDRMKAAAEKLNIKGHLCGIGERKEFLYGPTDIEGHIGRDDLFYVLDFARVFPPTADSHVDEAFLYRLFRPEFVQTYHTPLSSDAYSPFGKVDAVSMSVNNQEVLEATKHLFNTCIPTVARWMDAHVKEVQWYQHLTEIIHREGINVRYLGIVRQHVTDPTLKRILLTEIVARVFKNIIREDLRKKMKELKSIEADSYIQVVMDFFNVILGDPTHQHEKLWFQDIKHEILRRFDNSLFPNGNVSHARAMTGID
ncbi:hypothetical protein SAMD00019534_081630 [Acytostelium subglobosum LB1]|uniref:hypothetical protein n=1 Tax=Acytostelium subglobosum LB1 TaxID=1410327 RepID=UPI000644D258|nr:hypothetical protein SAMD00019534_081630 [Acytostelium subglobosum LB1]GAM24988.1 hypothetical protein SAMD00019534_081630 [Acytostelium subglobosum LB1]|eukprot:XP_012752077.1 hypothetical protein SAMD00019534_081630 [Acytostelium subglobosum LB1]